MCVCYVCMSSSSFERPHMNVIYWSQLHFVHILDSLPHTFLHPSPPSLRKFPQRIKWVLKQGEGFVLSAEKVPFRTELATMPHLTFMEYVLHLIK